MMIALRSPHHRFLVVVLLLGMTSLLPGCGYNALQRLDEQVKADWSQVINQYRRRADLVPNLVAVVKKYARHEKEVFTAVTQARGGLGGVQVPVEALDGAALARFEQAQVGLSAALSRLIAVAENYPELKANTTFDTLMTQLEGTENRITVARKRYIEAVLAYNTKVREFPSVLTARLFGMRTRANFTVENEAAVATVPKVDFSR